MENSTNNSNESEIISTDEEQSEISEAQSLHQKIAELEKALLALNDSLLREKAECENIKKRAAKELEETSKYAVTGFAKDLIDVLENFHRATANMEAIANSGDENAKNFCEGILMVGKILNTAFEKHGITRIHPLNEAFDHNYHQAVTQVADAEKEPNTVMQVVRAGYKIRDRLLQPAMVVVSTKA